MKKYLVILFLGILSSCNSSNTEEHIDGIDGTDQFGPYILMDSCVKSHQQSYMTYYGNNIWQRRTYEKCDSSVIIKKHF